MNSSPSIISPVLALILLSLLFLTASTTTDLVEEICSESSKEDPNIDFTFCVSSFQSILPASDIVNLNSLGLISVALVKANVTSTTILIASLFEDETLDRKTKPGLRDCLDLYSDSISTLDDAEEDYNAKRFNDANMKISSVMDSSTTCEEGFQGFGVVSPLTQQNRHAFQLCAISLSIIKMQQLPHYMSILSTFAM